MSPRLICVASLLALAAPLLGGCDDEDGKAAATAAAAVPAATLHPRSAPGAEADPVTPVREPVVAGRFYEGTAPGLRRQVKGLLGKAARTDLPRPVRAVTAPHAGYVFSGSVAAAAMKQLDWQAVKTVVIVGGHEKPLDGASVYPKGSYRTPLGRAVIDSRLARDITACSSKIRYVPSAHRGDHALEVMVPFIQVAAPLARIVPIHFWSRDPKVIDECATAVARALHARLEPEGQSPSVVIVNSTDLSHYPDYETARTSDAAYLDAVETLDVAKILGAERSLRAKYAGRGLDCAACCTPGVALTVAVARKLGATGAKRVAYLNSGDSERFGDKARVVGYGAVAYYGRGAVAKLVPPPAPPPTPPSAVKEKKSMSISVEGRKMLLRIARESIAAALEGKPVPDYEIPKELEVPAGVFVTLKKGERLRGCIGIFEADKPVWKQVAEYARNSAFRDPRFGRLAADELDEVWIEISVLSKPVPIDDPMKIEIGRHGIWIISADGRRRGTYLPQVATEHNMSKEQFLSDCCSRKAGLAPDAWKDPAKAKVLVYTAVVFSERDAEGKGH